MTRGARSVARVTAIDELHALLKADLAGETPFRDQPIQPIHWRVARLASTVTAGSAEVPFQHVSARRVDMRGVERFRAEIGRFDTGHGQSGGGGGDCHVDGQGGGRGQGDGHGHGDRHVDGQGGGRGDGRGQGDGQGQGGGRGNGRGQGDGQGHGGGRGDGGGYGHGDGRDREELIMYLIANVKRLARGDYSAPVGRALFSAIAEAVLLLARMTFEVVPATELTQKYFNHARQLAHRADNRSLEAAALAAMSQQARYAGVADEAVQLAAAARQLVGAYALP